MSSKRLLETHGLSGGKRRKGQVPEPRVKKADGGKGIYKQPVAQLDIVDRSKAADAERARCKFDMAFFYEHCIAKTIKNRHTGEMMTQRLGKIHHFLIDFLTFPLIAYGAAFAHCDLTKHLPERVQSTGDFQERGLYWPTLNGEPVIQDGPDGVVSKMYYESQTIWTGLVVRIKGDGRQKCALLPRGHLKSTLGNSTFNLWQLIKDPTLRILVRSGTSGNAKTFLSEVKDNFESNDRFMRLFGDLGSFGKRDKSWNTEMIELNFPNENKRGKEKSILAQGANAEVTGLHFDHMTFDDIVGEKTKPKELPELCNKVERSHSLLAPDGTFDDIGTRWNPLDPHGMFVDCKHEMGEDTSFMVCTIRDAEGNPIWPEEYTERVIQRLRRAQKDDTIYYGQQYNQFTGTSSRVFRREWIRRYEGDPLTVARDRKLDIFIGFDTTSAKEEVVKRKSDYTSGFVLGQSRENPRVFYFLDGFNEKLPGSSIADAIVDLVWKWKGIAGDYGGQVTAGFEDISHTKFLASALQFAMRSRGIKPFGFRLLSADQGKERIRLLADPYADYAFLWPDTMFKKVIVPLQGKENEPYDLVEALLDMFVSYPAVQYDDLLDAHAYAYQIAYPQPWLGVVRAHPSAKAQQDKSVFTREMALKESRQRGEPAHHERNQGRQEMDLGGY